MKRPFGIYIHFPFCIEKCGYCGFYSNPTDPDRLSDRDAIERWKKSLLVEWDRWREEGRWGDSRLVSVFFGGGTPSLLSGRQIESILDRIAESYDLDSAEITLEANPESLNPEKLDELRRAGANRLSLGVQSFHDSTLQWLGRIHDADTALRVVGQARIAGWENLSIDLIFGHTHQSPETWRADLQQAISLEPDHISTYALTLEPESEWFSHADSHAKTSDPDFQADQMDFTFDTLEANGYAGYEISNFARPNRPCQHNLLYWRWEDYLGLGPSAHSFFGGSGHGVRWANPADLGRYHDSMNRLGSPWTLQKLTQLDAWEELWLGRLRLAEGVSRDVLEPFPIQWQEEIQRRAQRLAQRSPGWLEKNGESWRLTQVGRRLADEVLIELLDPTHKIADR